MNEAWRVRNHSRSSGLNKPEGMLELELSVLLWKANHAKILCPLSFWWNSMKLSFKFIGFLRKTKVKCHRIILNCKHVFFKPWWGGDGGGALVVACSSVSGMSFCYICYIIISPKHTNTQIWKKRETRTDGTRKKVEKGGVVIKCRLETNGVRGLLTRLRNSLLTDGLIQKRQGDTSCWRTDRLRWEFKPVTWHTKPPPLTSKCLQSLFQGVIGGREQLFKWRSKRVFVEIWEMMRVNNQMNVARNTWRRQRWL